MSKNFELLQQIGNDEELFRTVVRSPDTAVAVKFEPGSELDKETFEVLMEKASLMGLLRTANEPTQQTLPEPPEFSFEAGVESASRKVPGGDTSADAFRNSRNPTSPIDDLGMFVENRVRLNTAKGVSVPKIFQSDGNPKDIPGTASEESLPKTKKKIQQRSQNRSVSVPWLDSIKSAANGWEWKERIRSNQSGADLEAITREEEIKLVQRVFPDAALDSPRVALFAGLESGIRCARTCARAAELLAARAEGPVCVVDANFQMPSLHEYFGVDNLKGLAEATVESGPIQNFAQQIPQPDLWLIPSGKAAAQLRFPAMADGLRVRIEELRETFKYVVIHSGPLRMETNAVLLSRWTDGVVLVVEANATRRDAARRVKEMLYAANVNLLGIVLNNRTFPIPDVIYRRLY
jgi:Mrp family chromosome partitioning ATPase